MQGYYMLWTEKKLISYCFVNEDIGPVKGKNAFKDLIFISISTIN